MCAVCYGQAHGLSSYSVQPNTLCVIHYQEWSAEKTAFDIGESDYFGIIQITEIPGAAAPQPQLCQVTTL